MTPGSQVPKPEAAIYVWAVVVMTLISGILTLGILYLRPGSDPLDVLANVAKGAAPTIAGVLAFLKSQETHLSVNSRLDAFMKEHANSARLEGLAQGVAEEKARTVVPAADAPFVTGVVSGNATRVVAAPVLVVAPPAPPAPEKAPGPVE